MQKHLSDRDNICCVYSMLFNIHIKNVSFPPTQDSTQRIAMAIEIIFPYG